MKYTPFQINLIEEQEGGYTVLVPQLPGCISYGKSIDEAKENAKEAIQLHLENIRAHDKNSLRNLPKQSVFSTIVQVNSSYA